jgi:hypothetical protein
MPLEHREKKGIPCAEADSGDRDAYLGSMPKLMDRPAGPGRKPNNLGAIALVVPLVAILAASGWYAARAWVSIEGPGMPANGYIAMTLGVVFSLVVGCGLMALLFYSNRHGYDEISYEDRQRRDDDRA